MKAVAKGSSRDRLIRLLADGEFHSGERLARQLGVSRAAVWKSLSGLEALGLELHRVPNRGYRLAQPIELLDSAALERELGADTRKRVRRLEVLTHTESTNSRLFAVQDLPAGKLDICIAEFQTAGRGRRGRSWVAPFGSGLCLSINWTFPEVPRQPSALTLAAGVGIWRALRKQGAKGIGLKWPNDILHRDRKLGGILSELRAETGGPAYVVIGAGINLRLNERARAAISASGVDAADLEEACQHVKIERNLLAAAIIRELVAVLVEFGSEGFRPFMTEWRDADALAGSAARVQVGAQVHRGVARGIDEDGALLLETPGKLLRFISGEVTVRSEV